MATRRAGGHSNRLEGLLGGRLEGRLVGRQRALPRRTRRALHRQADPAELLAERVEVDAALHRARPPPGPLHGLDDDGLRLDELIALRVADLLLRELQQAQPEQVREVGVDALDVLAAGQLGDHVQPAQTSCEPMPRGRLVRTSMAGWGPFK